MAASAERRNVSSVEAPPFDVLIHGAGPVGCTLALALQGCALRTAMFDPSFAKPAAGFRPIALSYASRLILERIGAWGAFPVTPIENVHVSQQGGFGRTRLEARDAGVPVLGYVTEYAPLVAALRGRVQTSGVEVAMEAFNARCDVHAEGSTDDAEEKRYSHDALLSVVRLASPAATSAYERFTPEGPLALLPHAGRYALIWSASPGRARRLAEMPTAAFLAELALAMGRLPTPVEVGERTVRPLAMRVRAARVAERSVYIGNAAQTLHPVAGQGLNLGLRDAWELAQILRSAQDPGDPATLERYSARRRFDAAATARVTDLLAGGFLGTGRLARSARGAALTLLDILPGPRRFFARRMIYGPSALP
jgi:2-octaprenyl-6-methoxyphenol hydroxylase